MWKLQQGTIWPRSVTLSDDETSPTYSQTHAAVLRESVAGALIQLFRCDGSIFTVMQALSRQ